MWPLLPILLLLNTPTFYQDHCWTQCNSQHTGESCIELIHDCSHLRSTFASKSPHILPRFHKLNIFFIAAPRVKKSEDPKFIAKMKDFRDFPVDWSLFWNENGMFFTNGEMALFLKSICYCSWRQVLEYKDSSGCCPLSITRPLSHIRGQVRFVLALVSNFVSNGGFYNAHCSVLILDLSEGTTVSQQDPVIDAMINGSKLPTKLTIELGKNLFGRKKLA